MHIAFFKGYCRNCGPSPLVGPMCSVCWDILYNVIKFLPMLCNRKAVKPDSVSAAKWRVWRDFFSKHRDRIFWKGNSQKPRYRVSPENGEPTIFHLEYTSNGVLISTWGLMVVSKEKALEILRQIHHGSFEGGCKVVGVNSLVRQFSFEFSCNGIRQQTK